MNIFPEILLHYGQLMLALLIFFLTGRLVRWRLGITDRFFAELFFSAFIGMTTWIALYAIIKSGGRTINMLWILPAAYFLYQYRPTRDTIRKPFLGFEITAHHVGAVLLGTLLCYGWEAYFFFWPGGPMKYHIPWEDNVYYARVIEGLLANGHESTYNLEFYISSNESKAVVFYHYYELWLSAIFCEIFQESSLVGLLAITTPLFSIFVLVGIMGYIEKTSLPIFIGFIIAFFLLFLQGIFLEGYRDLGFLAYTEDLHSNLMSAIAKRNAPYYVFAVGFLLLINKRLFKDASVFILSLSIATITALPSVVSGIALAAIIFWIRGTYKISDLVLTATYIVTFVLFILVFNHLYILKTNNDISIGVLYEKLLSFSAVRTKINLFVGLFINMLVLYMPWLVILSYFIYLKKIHIVEEAVILLSSIVFTGAFFWAILSPEANVFQFFIHTTSSLLNLFLSITIIQIFESQKNNLFKKHNLITLILISVLLFINIRRAYHTQSYIFKFDKIFDDSYLAEIMKKSKYISGLGGSLLPYEFIHTTTPLSTQLGDYLFLTNRRTFTSSLNTFEVKTAIGQTQKHLNLMAFTQFVNRQQAEGTFQSIAQSQADFIRKHRMGYLIVSKSALVPPTIQPMITDSIVDSKSGERFYFLKP